MNLFTHLKNRGFNLNLYPESFVSQSKGVVTFTLWNTSGQMVGYQQYRPFAPKNDRSLKPEELRYFTWVTKAVNSLENTAFGVPQLNNKQKYVFLVEGVFDAVKLHNMGLNALAVLGCNTKHLRSWLWSLGYLVVPVCEGDKAGQQLAKFSNCGLVEYLPEDVDLGDMTQEEVFSRFEKYL